ncbi:MAG: helix-turn-helix domain-containing protein [Mycolicibacterium neoaurum]|uniref:helix-turn-helix domain-containing protein n=1 Tax=Mycolicibacterium neoaurum TaxID=1795 RepID=UPI002FF74963
MSEVTLITTSQVADKYQITPSAVRRWVAAGKLVPAATTPGGHYRFDPADVDALLKATA